MTNQPEKYINISTSHSPGYNEQITDIMVCIRLYRLTQIRRTYLTRFLFGLHEHYVGKF